MGGGQLFFSQPFNAVPTPSLGDDFRNEDPSESAVDFPRTASPCFSWNLASSLEKGGGEGGRCASPSLLQIVLQGSHAFLSTPKAPDTSVVHGILGNKH